MAVYSLYHHIRLSEVRDQVMTDLGRQGNLLQTKLELSTPLLSTDSGKPLDFSSTPTFEEVAAAILDLIFLKTVQWTKVQQYIASQLMEKTLSRPINVVNYGPGLGMSASAFPHAQDNDVTIIDAAKISSHASTAPGVSRLAWDDIAIVGMAVELPGASDANTLWQQLVDGFQACSEVISFRYEAYSLSTY